MLLVLGISALLMIAELLTVSLFLPRRVASTLHSMSERVMANSSLAFNRGNPAASDLLAASRLDYVQDVRSSLVALDRVKAQGSDIDERDFHLARQNSSSDGLADSRMTPPQNLPESHPQTDRECLEPSSSNFCSCDDAKRSNHPYEAFVGQRAGLVFSARLQSKYIGKLSKDSIVLEIGGNTGRDTSAFIRAGASRVITLEPMPENQAMLHKLAEKSTAHISVLPYGASGFSRNTTIYLSKHDQNEGSTMFGNHSNAKPTQTVYSRDIVQVWQDQKLSQVSLLSLNCEGCEFEVLERLICSGYIARVERLIVAWHERTVGPTVNWKRCAIAQKLMPTHHVTFCSSPWEGFAAIQQKTPSPHAVLLPTVGQEESGNLCHNWTKTEYSFPTPKDLNSRHLYLDPVVGNEAISSRLCANVTFIAGRVGMAEIFTVQDFLSGRVVEGGRGDPKKASGIYPETKDGLNAFAAEYAKSLMSLGAQDLLASFPNIRGAESAVFSKIVSDRVQIVHHRSLEPFYFPDHPWSRHLAGKMVLIVHPFRDSIECQLRRASDLFPGTQILPVFSAKLVKMFQCLGGSKCPHNDWHGTLRATIGLIDGVGHFDIAIIGAGSYSLPLAVHCKQEKNASAIIIGGASQLLFGLKGRRWDQHPVLRNLYKSAWIYPLKVDTPLDAASIEHGGPYWGRGAQVATTCPVAQ